MPPIKKVKPEDKTPNWALSITGMAKERVQSVGGCALLNEMSKTQQVELKGTFWLVTPPITSPISAETIFQWIERSDWYETGHEAKQARQGEDLVLKLDFDARTLIKEELK